MLDKTNEYFLRGVAVVFFVKAVAVWYLLSGEEEYLILMLAVALGHLILQCTTAVFFHSLAMRLGALGFESDSKWVPGILGFFSVHVASIYEDAEWIQNFDFYVQVLIGFVFIAVMAFFSTYNAQKRSKITVENK
ncbi:hypothetical protein [Vibrio parahaemolyticus]|uniref:hypothetical protein n=1 Tax=Vibrio parahaemolyticus TaxID=670 RepID=UPI0004069FB5|nr:hypothetical protein [Vibrio parahaemolyticus]